MFPSRIICVALLLAFAARNTEPVTLRFFFELAWQAPLVALLLVFFVAGAALGAADRGRARRGLPARAAEA
jgi:putative membrane protein